MDLNTLRTRLSRFAKARDWHQFHTPKNLAMALTVEAAELAEHFQWLEGEASRNLPPDRRAQIAEELADVQIYLIRLADELGIDLEQAVEAKIEKNEQKYPVDKVRGSARKYTDYE